MSHNIDFDWSTVYAPLTEQEEAELNIRIQGEKNKEEKDRRDAYAKSIRATGNDWMDATKRRIASAKKSLESMYNSAKHNDGEGVQAWFNYAIEDIDSINEMGFEAREYAKNLKQKAYDMRDEYIKTHSISKMENGGSFENYMVQYNLYDKKGEHIDIGMKYKSNALEDKGHYTKEEATEEANKMNEKDPKFKARAVKYSKGGGVGDVLSPSELLKSIKEQIKFHRQELYKDEFGARRNIAMSESKRLEINEIINDALESKDEVKIKQAYQDAKEYLSELNNISRRYSSEDFLSNGGVSEDIFVKIKNEFGTPPKGADLRDVNGVVYVYYYSPNKEASDWANKIKDKYPSGVVYTDTSKMENGGGVEREMWDIINKDGSVFKKNLTSKQIQKLGDSKHFFVAVQNIQKGGNREVVKQVKNNMMFNEHWTQREVNELISKAKKNKKEYGKDYLVLSNDSGKSIETRSKTDFMQYPQNYRDAHEIIFDTTELTQTVKTNDMKNNRMDDGGLINTEEMVVDRGQPLSDPTIQNADIGSQSYVPKSLVCETVDTVAPVSMLYEMNRSLTEIDREVRGIDDFVRVKLGYKDMMAMCRAFSAEQIDAIANAIYQIEKGQALIVGDMTGVGKGRIAAGIIRYAKLINKTPIFFTEKPNLFSDIYRDLIAIGADDGVPLYYAGKEVEKIKQVTRKVIVDKIMEDIEDGDFELEYNEDKLFKKGYETETKQCIEEYRDLYFPSDVIKETQYIRNDDYKKHTRNAVQLVPFIVNGRSAKTEIKDESGNIIYEGISNAKPEMKLKKAFESKNLPKGYDVVLLTYSQVNSPTRAIDKVQWLNNVGNDSIVIMDESHNASGSSQTGAFLQEFIQKAAGVCFLSATFAKRPDNMPIYAMKTAIQDADMDNETLIRAILAGGVALQEILSGELVSEGQMLRRERSYEGVVVNYNYLDERMLDRDVPLPNFNLKEAHEAVSDKVTALVRRMMEFQMEHVNPIIEELDEKLKEEQAEAGQEEGVKEAGINNTPIFSGIFNLINQLLLSIKADAVADFAVTRMKEGKKVIIGFSNTLESFLDYLIQGDKDEKIKTDFSIILKRRLDKILQYTVTNAEGEREKLALNPDDYPMMGEAYYAILKDIEKASTGITISPIDRILTKIKEAGYTVGEVTGRKKYVEFLPDGKHGLVKSRRIETANDLFRRFNDNDIDCLLINQSGATGASAQAIKSKKAYVVNYNKDGSVIIPKSLEPKNEVKQRVMIILQAELDINKEVQKRGRINRTGQVFKPIYDYVISAIPAEERLMMMLQKKLKSLDANTTSNQKQSKKLLDVVDFLNIYGDDKVVEFLKANPEYNKLTGNILKFEMNNPTEDTKAITDKAHKVSGRVAILPVEMQSNFYRTVSESYQNLEMQLKASGEWNLEVENMDLDAKVIDKSAVMVGNPAKNSVFAEAVFMEKCQVNNLRKPYKESEVVNLVSQSLTLTDDKGRVKTFTADEKTGYLLQKFYDYIENNEKEIIESLNERMKEDIEAASNAPSLDKMKKEERKTVVEEKTKKITDEYTQRIEGTKRSTKHLRQMIESNLNYFYPKRLLEYPLANYEVTGDTVKCICLGIDVNFKLNNPFAPSGMTLKIVLPNGMRMLKFPLSDSFISQIRIATEANYDTKNASESEADAFIEDWDELTKESQANRVTKFIITGNILKGYGNADYRIGGKLISYTTSEGLIKKGILLPENFKTSDVRVQVPINRMVNYIAGMRDGSLVQLYSTMVTLQRRGNFYLLILTSKANPYIDIKSDSDINNIAFETEFVKKSGNWQNQFEGVALKKLLNILWDKYKMSASVTQTVFESLKEEFDVKEREHNEIDGTEELIKKHNQALQEYERSKKFEVIDEKALKKMDELEKENYEFKKRVAELEGLRRLYKVSRLMNDDIRKRKREAEDAAKATAQMEEGGTIDSDRRFTDSDYSKLMQTNKFKGTWSGHVWEIYPDGGGKVLGKFNPHKTTLFIAGAKDKTNPLVEWLQNNSYVSADEYAKLKTGGGLNEKKFKEDDFVIGIGQNKHTGDKGQIFGYTDQTGNPIAKGLVVVRMLDNSGLKYIPETDLAFYNPKGVPLSEKMKARLKELFPNEPHYLPKYQEEYEAKKGSMSKGGGVGYGTKSDGEIWTDWTEKQRHHFLTDHYEEILRFQQNLLDNKFIQEKYLSNSSDVTKFENYEYQKLPIPVRHALQDHIEQGRYGNGGGVGKSIFQKIGKVEAKKIFDKGEEYIYLSTGLIGGSKLEIKKGVSMLHGEYVNDFNEFVNDFVSYNKNVVFYKEGKDYPKKSNGGDVDDEEFVVHGTYTVSNAGGYEIMLSNDGESARVRDAFGSDNPKTSDWLEIEYVTDEEGERDEEGFLPSEPVIDPKGYNIPLNMVMRVNRFENGGGVKTYLEESEIKEKDSLYRFVVNSLPSGTVGSRLVDLGYSDGLKYDVIDKVKGRMITILAERGDETYSIVALNSLIKDAAVSLFGTVNVGSSSVGRKMYNNGGGVKEINRIRDTEDDDSFQLIQNSQDLEEIYKSHAPKFLTEKDSNDRLYSEIIGGAFVKFTPDGSDLEKIYVFEGSVPDLSKPLFEIYPTNTYFE